MQQRHLVARTVVEHLDELEETFLPILDAYIANAESAAAAAAGGGADAMGDAKQLASLLACMREEVLARLDEQLPPAMQVINAALAAPDGGARMALLRAHAVSPTWGAAPRSSSISGGGATPTQQQQQGGAPVVEAEVVGAAQPAAASDDDGSEGVPQPGLPHVPATELERAVSTLLTDMEQMPAIPDRWGGGRGGGVRQAEAGPSVGGRQMRAAARDALAPRSCPPGGCLPSCASCKRRCSGWCWSKTLRLGWRWRGRGGAGGAPRTTALSPRWRRNVSAGGWLGEASLWPWGQCRAPPLPSSTS